MTLTFDQIMIAMSNEKERLYTEKEGQYLAFIFYYTKLNGVAPAQADFQRYFSVTAPTIHQMILQLERKGFIKRIPKTARSLILCIDEDDLPKLK